MHTLVFSKYFSFHKQTKNMLIKFTGNSKWALMWMVVCLVSLWWIYDPSPVELDTSFPATQKQETEKENWWMDGKYQVPFWITSFIKEKYKQCIRENIIFRKCLRVSHWSLLGYQQHSSTLSHPTHHFVATSLNMFPITIASFLNELWWVRRRWGRVRMAGTSLPFPKKEIRHRHIFGIVQDRAKNPESKW